VIYERGLTHVTIYRWVQRFTPLLIDAARPCRHAPGDRWFADETYLKVARWWVYPYRAIDQFGQVMDVLISEKRDLAATHRFVTRALWHGSRPTEVSTDRATAYPRTLDDLLPATCHAMKKDANNPIESDHSRLKSRLRPMRGLKRLRCARVISADTPSCRTSAAATTNSESKNPRHCRWRLPSPNWPWRSDQPESTISPAPASRNATVLSLAHR
jgi:transposase, IS6 family